MGVRVDHITKTTSRITTTTDANTSHPRRIARFSFWFIERNVALFLFNRWSGTSALVGLEAAAGQSFGDHDAKWEGPHGRVVANGIADDDQDFALRGTPAVLERPPGDAVDTGYRLDGVHLWIAPSDADDYVYLERAGTFERWPRAVHPIGCS